VRRFTVGVPLCETIAGIRWVTDRFGTLDTLVANAGIWDYYRQRTRMTGAQLRAIFDELFDINIKGYLLAAEAAWRELVKTRGSIVMTLSNASFYVNGGGPIYTASKHACLGLMRELAYELAPKVRVNGVACGAMNTALRGPAALDMQDRTLAASFAKKKPDDPPPTDPAVRLEHRSQGFHRILRSAGQPRAERTHYRTSDFGRRRYRRAGVRFGCWR
jgi:NAD(P)-dependent dehydrogenase (short-subunit alcohol dehydrogenase family)